MRVFYQKSDDEFVLSEIKEVLKLRPSYGYRRITAIINRRRKLEFKSRINKKRVLRIMQINGLTLQRTSHPRDHQPTGKVMAEPGYRPDLLTICDFVFAYAAKQYQ